MRIRQLENILSKFSDGTFYLNLEAPASPNQSFTIRNFVNFRQLISFLEESEIEIFATIINIIKDDKLYTPIILDKQERDNYGLNAIDAMRVNEWSKYLEHAFQNISLINDCYYPKLSKETISIKIHDSSDLKDMIIILKLIELNISQVINHKGIDGELKVENWENGSRWINLTLKTTAAYAIIASVIWSSAVVAKKIQENQVLYETISAMKLKNESLNDIKETQKRLLKELVEAEADYIYEENINKSKKDVEYVERLKNSIRSFSEIILKGTEVHPGIVGNESVDNLFPDFKHLDTIESKVPRIEHKK